ncbi:MAG: ABC transporter permease [Anaerolineae bacterium]|nr:ABC transporter permease [Anaerolineae bacterium]
MTRYIIRRLIQALPIMFGITVLSYLLMTAAPGGPTAALALDPRLSPQQRQAAAARLGVNDPWPVQYLRWLLGDDWMWVDVDGDGILDEPGTRRGVLRGDFGNSYTYRQPALQVVGERVLATLELGLAALLIGLLLGVPIGVISAVKRGSWFDSFARVMAVVFNAVPIFWLGLILILIFGSLLGVLPMGGRCPTTLLGGCPPVHERLNYLLLPTIVLATGGIAGYSRYLRASTLEVLGEDYVRTAKAKGLRDRQVYMTHAARNALIPLATFLGPAITGLLGGAAVTETIFSWPGLGRLAVNSVLQQDYPVIMAVVIISAIATILGYIISDILYAAIDPRIRFS